MNTKKKEKKNSMYITFIMSSLKKKGGPERDKTSEKGFKMSPFSAVDCKSFMHWSAELSRTGSLHLSDGSSKRVSEWVKLPSISMTHS